MRSVKLATAGVLFVLALPFFIALNDSSVWDANEAFYVQTPREMVESGDWLIPTFNGRPRLNKPPLAYWIVAAGYRVAGISVGVERLLTALLAVGSILILFQIGRRLTDSATALLGAALLATGFRFLILARRLIIDMLLLFCVLAALAFFLRWLQEGKRWDFRLAALFLALGFLTKGPVVAIPAAAVLAYMLLAPERRARLREAPWFSAAAIFLMAASSWFLALGLTGGWEPVRDFFLTENLGRYRGIDFGPQRGVLYYLGVFLVDFFPWSLFFPAALLWGWRHRSPRWRTGTLPLLACWMAAIFLFFTFSRNKQEYYILPLYPAAALWTAAYLRSAAPGLLLRLPVAVLLGASGILLALVARALFRGEDALWLPLPLVLTSAVLLAAGRFPAAALALSLFYLAAFGVYLEAFERYKPVRPLARQIPLQPDLRAGYAGLAAPSLRFYLDRDIQELEDAGDAARLLESDDPVYLVIRAEDFPALQSSTRRRLQIVAVRPKLYTTARSFIQSIRSGGIDNLQEHWTRDVYLVSNQVPP